MIWSFSFDCMHGLDLGVMNRLLQMMIDKKFINMKKAAEIISVIKPYIPSDFARRPRPFEVLKFFKASELRLFALYLGIVVIRECVSDERIYSNFLKFSIAYRLLVAEEISADNLNLADNLIQEFVQGISDIYGPHNVTPYIHGMLHLPEFARRYGKVDNFSAYKFENYYQMIRQWVRKGSDYCHQIYSRWMQNSGVAQADPNSKNKFGSRVLRNNQKDACLLLNDGTVYTITEKALTLEGFRFKGRKFQTKEDFFTYPIPSSNVNIFQVSNLSIEVEVIPMQNLSTKLLMVPSKDKFVVMPIIHY